MIQIDSNPELVEGVGSYFNDTRQYKEEAKPKGKRGRRKAIDIGSALDGSALKMNKINLCPKKLEEKNSLKQQKKLDFKSGIRTKKAQKENYQWKTNTQLWKKARQTFLTVFKRNNQKKDL